MFINPRIVIEEGWITHPNCSTLEDWENNKFISPNAIDFTLDRLFSINHNNDFYISENGKKMRGGTELSPVINRRDNFKYWRLDADSIYDGMSNMYVNIPEGVACILITRSTFCRNGIFITSGMYDSGFCGNVGYVIHNRSSYAHIAPETRIGQIIFIHSDNALQYKGGYNHDDGTHWSESDT